MRIVSLLPSATEIVHALGLGESLVAVSQDCDYPPGVRELPTVTASQIDSDRSSRAIDQAVKETAHRGKSLYHLDEDRLEALNPDLVLTQEQCEVCAPAFDDVKDTCRILEGDPQVVSLEAHSLEDILNTIFKVGDLTGARSVADQVVGDLKKRRDDILDAVAGEHPEYEKTLTLEWLDPPYVSGHWVPEMTQLLGLNSFRRPNSPAKQVGLDEIERYDPGLTVLMPCGFGLERTIDEGRNFLQDLNGNDLFGDRIYAVDGSSYFSRPGPRVFEGLAVMAAIVYPSSSKQISPPESAVERLA
ncbi:MAG: ABC transporter substrate-binding protein [bacterium]